MSNYPETLQEAIVYFFDKDNCLNYLAERRWPNGVVCPTCGSKNVSFLASRRLWQCKTRHAKAQFSIKIGTIFEDSPIGLDKWLCAMWMVANCKNGVSSHEISRTIKVTQKTAWFMLHRIRLAMQSSSNNKIGGGGSEVEVDESFIGGKARNMYRGQRKVKGRGFVGKSIVVGLLERHGEVRTSIVSNTRRGTLQREVRNNVESGSSVYTDALASYDGLNDEQVVDHAECYVKGNVHTNSLENYWSLLKRGINGTYVSVEPFHLFRYLDEQSFRFNLRKHHNDASRFEFLLSQTVGRRVTYKQLTGNDNNAECMK